MPNDIALTDRPRRPRLAALAVALWFLALAGAGYCARAAARGAADATGARSVGRAAASYANPLARFALPAREEFTLEGQIRERLDAGSYAYLRLRDDAGRDAWVVTLRRAAPAQGRARAWVVGRAATFDSPRLRRSFAPLLFAVVRPAAAVAAQEGHSP